MAAAYQTIAQFKRWVVLDDSIDDDSIDDALKAASRGIDNYCNTHFWQTSAATARVFDACDPYRLRINDAAVIAEVATDTNSDGTYETVWAAGDYQLWPLNPDAAPETLPYSQILAIGALTFPPVVRRGGLVRVKGTWGWPAVPEAVVQATRLMTNKLLKRTNSPEGIAGFDDFGTVRISSREDPDVVRYLTPYRTQRRAGGWAFA